MSSRRPHRRRVMEEAERSGISVRAFCRQRGIAENVFYYWRRVLEADRGQSSTRNEPGQFLLVDPKADTREAGEATLELIVERERRLRIPPGTDGATLRVVRAALTPAP
jgi:transposase-like protein